MNGSVRTPTAVFLITCLLLLGSQNFISFAGADEPAIERVPEPSVNVSHKYNFYETYNGIARGYFDNENWNVGINHGNVITLLTARNYTTRQNETVVDYTQNINFYIGGKFYISMFTIDHILLSIDNQRLIIPLKSCDHFEVERSPIRYDGPIPTLDCNITYKGIRVYPDSPTDSSFDLTLIHHYRGDWNSSSIKLEALFDFNHTRFYNGTDPLTGEPFTAEIRYTMVLTDPDTPGDGDNTVSPSRITNETLEYNLTLDNGVPYTLSKLEMKDSFTIYNHGGARTAVGYSFMKKGGNSSDFWRGYGSNAAGVIHGFPNLTYGDTQSIKSDPEITVFHDRVSVQPGPMTVAISIAAAVALVAIGIAIFYMRRKKRSSASSSVPENNETEHLPPPPPARER